MAMNTLSTRKDDGYCLCTIASFDRWAKLYDPFLSLFRLKRVCRETVDMNGVRPVTQCSTSARASVMWPW